MLNPIAVTLFSGVGSSSKALRDLGYEVYPHDFMPEAVQTLKANGFNLAQEVDVREIDYSVFDGDEVHVLAGGPPCQPFSQSHQGDGQYDKRDMIPEFLRAVAETFPRLFVMEEVQTLTWKKHAAYLARVEDDMRSLGYRVEHRILNAADYGHGQARKRLFVLGVREDVAQDIEATWSRLKGLFPEHITAEESSVFSWPNPESYESITMAERLGWDEATAYERASQAPVFGDYGWVFERASTTVVGSFRPDVQAKPGYRKAGDGPRQNTPGSVVTTLEERLILQDLPADWKVCGSESKRALQVGNSVPCGLIADLIDLNIW